jgi:hypothetical protein
MLTSAPMAAATATSDSRLACVVPASMRVKGSIDPRLLGDSGLAGGCIDPDPPNVVTDPADERPQSLLDQPIDRWASDRHEDIQHERALPGLICPVW